MIIIYCSNDDLISFSIHGAINIWNKNKLWKFISISKMKIIWQKKIENFSYYGFKLIKNKGMFLVEGKKTFNLRIFINDTYECIQSIENAHDDNILDLLN